MSDSGFTPFDTAVGRCGIAWGAHGITGIWLPGRLPRRSAAKPPAVVQRAIDEMTGLLEGEPRDLSTIELDMSAVPDFQRRVYAIARTIPPGETTTYGAIAMRIGAPGAGRAVGKALGQTPFPIVVPCHRVVAAGGKLGGFSADGGVATKKRLLAIESRALTLF
jgi:methylated-DNA-[protein]-cysteine S-methyltransferase